MEYGMEYGSLGPTLLPAYVFLTASVNTPQAPVMNMNYKLKINQIYMLLLLMATIWILCCNILLLIIRQVKLCWFDLTWFEKERVRGERDLDNETEKMWDRDTGRSDSICESGSGYPPTHHYKAVRPGLFSAFVRMHIITTDVLSFTTHAFHVNIEAFHLHSCLK